MFLLLKFDASRYFPVVRRVKMLGDVGGDDQKMEEVVGKRARTVRNYSEEQDDEKFQAQCNFSDESESGDDEESDDSFDQGAESESESEEDELVDTV
jgi:hypothetical protein